MSHLISALQPALEDKLVGLRGDLAVIREAQCHGCQCREWGRLQKGGGAAG